MWDAVQDRKKRIFSTFLLLGATGVLFLHQWVLAVEATAHVMPPVERQEIGEIVYMAQRVWERQEEVLLAGKSSVTGQSGGVLSAKDMTLLSEQTGLGKEAIITLGQQGCLEELLNIQEIYFAPVLVDAIKTTPLTVSEWLEEEPVPGYKGMPLVDVRDGDILVTKNSRFLGWRNGHAGLVVDAEAGLVLEAIMLGSPSQLCKIDKWENYPSFLVLRLKEEYRKNSIAGSVTAYASEHLVGVPYQLLAGVFAEKLYQAASGEEVIWSNPAETAIEALNGTQCAHLVWYAYLQFGIDLDSDGGLFVTPYDIQNSPYLEVVQSYGY